MRCVRRPCVTCGPVFLPFCNVENYHGNLGFLSWNIIEKSLQFFEACLWAWSSSTMQNKRPKKLTIYILNSSRELKYVFAFSMIFQYLDISWMFHIGIFWSTYLFTFIYHLSIIWYFAGQQFGSYVKCECSPWYMYIICKNVFVFRSSNVPVRGTSSKSTWRRTAVWMTFWRT